MNISELLKQQNVAVMENDFAKEIAELDEIGTYNQSIFNKITKDMEKVDKELKVWEDFSFGTVAGKILGFLRTIFFNFKHRDELCAIMGISPIIVDKYLSIAGNAPYIDKNNTVIDARLMNVTETRKLVQYVCAKINVVCTEEDLLKINEDNEKRRNELALKNAIETKNNSSLTKIENNLYVNDNRKIYNGSIDA